MENYVVFSDLHLNNWPCSKVLQDGKNELLLAGLDVVIQIYSYCYSQDVATIYFLGDLFEHRNKIDTSVYSNDAFDLFSTLFSSESDIDLILIPGNHDQLNKKGKTNLKPYSSIDNIHLYDKPKISKLKNGCKLYTCPHQYDLDIVYEFLEASTGYDTIMIHQLLLNSPTATGYTFSKKEQVIDTSKFKFKRLFCGHNHVPFTSEDDRVVNLGSPMHHSFSDVQHPHKRFIHVKGDDITSVYTKFPIFSEEGKDDSKSATYVRAKRAEVKKETSRIDLSPNDNTAQILTRYLKYKEVSNSSLLFAEGMSLLGEKV